MNILDAVLIVELVIILTFGGLCLIGAICEYIDKKLNPRYPYCDIDPLCHPAFAWDTEGNGWIGKCKVIENG